MTKRMVAVFFKLMLIAHVTSGQDLSKYVDPFIGTTGEGNTVPGATLPFGMVQLSPDTRITDPSGYDYKDSVILGFSHTHLSGTGLGDLGDILTMPVVTGMANGFNLFPDFSSSFSHANEHSSPGFYTVFLKNPKVKVELTATERCGMQQYTYTGPEINRGVFIDLKHSVFGTRNVWIPDDVHDCALTIENDYTISGFKKSTGWAPQQIVYFVMQFSEPIARSFLKGKRSGSATITAVKDTTVQAVILFKNIKKLLIRTGISATSIDGARKNLQTEIEDWNFKKIRQKARAIWNTQLQKIVVKTDNAKKKIFYTALYHTMVTPNLISDVDNSFFGPDFKNHVSKKGSYYSTLSLWDTYRAVHPLYTIINPRKNTDFINSMLQHFEILGRLPLWTLWGTENYCMTGNHAIPVIVDAFLKGDNNIDTALAWKAIITSATKLFPRYNFNVIDNYGYTPDNFGTYGSRGDNNRYNLIDKYGFLPHDSMRQSATILLELCYDDWCIAQMAKNLGKQKEYQYFRNRSEKYKNIFDKSIGFVRPRNADGTWVSPFDPYSFSNWQTSAFVEGNAFQYSFYVPQQVDTLISLFKGERHFETMLDSLFTAKNKHQNSSGAITGFIGQYAHGNEPSHHIAYLYNFVNRQFKTAERVQNILATQYSSEPDGLSGNDDCGQMSAWYVFSALGFYPVNPADGRYYFGTSALQEATFNLDNGKQFVINYHGAASPNIYMEKMVLNGTTMSANYLLHADIMKGGRLDIYMSNEPASSHRSSYAK